MFLSSCFSLSKMANNDEGNHFIEKEDKYVNIIFADHFINDTISLFLEEVLIMDNCLINSDLAHGLTGQNIFIKATKQKNSYKLISSKCNLNQDNTLLLNVIKGKLHLRINLNNRIYERDLSIKDGNYIFIDKLENSINIQQQDWGFSY